MVCVPWPALDAFVYKLGLECQAWAVGSLQGGHTPKGVGLRVQVAKAGLWDWYAQGIMVPQPAG